MRLIVVLTINQDSGRVAGEPPAIGSSRTSEIAPPAHLRDIAMILLAQVIWFRNETVSVATDSRTVMIEPLPAILSLGVI